MRGGGLSASDQPEALMLAILGDFGADEPPTVVRRLVEKLYTLTGADEKRLRECLSMLEILADNEGWMSVAKSTISELRKVDCAALPPYEKNPDRPSGPAADQ